MRLDVLALKYGIRRADRIPFHVIHNQIATFLNRLEVVQRIIRRKVAEETVAGGGYVAATRMQEA